MPTNTNQAQATKVVTGRVRAAYVHIFEPWAATEKQDPKHSITILIDKDDKETLSAIKRGITAAKEAGKDSKWGGTIPDNLKLPIRDGDVEKPDQEEFQHCWYINCTSKMKPGIVDKRRIAIEDSSEVYSGCYVRVSINFFPYNTAGNRGISAGLNHVLKLSDGDFLGGRTRPEDDFGPAEKEDDLFGDDDLPF